MSSWTHGSDRWIQGCKKLENPHSLKFNEMAEYSLWSFESVHRESVHCGDASSTSGPGLPGDNVGLNIKGLDTNNMPRSGDVNVYKKDSTLGRTKEFNAQTQVLDIPNETKVDCSPIGFVRSGCTACRNFSLYVEDGKGKPSVVIVTQTIPRKRWLIREPLSGSTSRLHLQCTPSLLLSWTTLRQHPQFLSWNTSRQHPQFLSWNTLRRHPQFLSWKHIAPAPAVPVVEHIAPAPAVPVVEYIAPAPAVPVVEYIVPAPAAPVAEYIVPAPAVPVVEHIASVPTSTPAVSSLATSVQSRQSAHRVSTEVPTVSSRHHHDELLRAERVLRARAARQGYLFRQMKRRDTQLAAQLTSLGKACEVARGSPVTSLLVPVAMREQGLSSKLLAFEKQLEDHEVAVLELERQVAVLELGENFKQLSDLVNETKELECERQLAVVELEARF